MSTPVFDPNMPFEVVPEEKPKFDPNAPFEVVDDGPKQESWPKQLLRSSLDTLPVIGAGAGGVIGAGAGLFGGPAAPASVPLGGIAGGGLGYAAGSELADLGKQYLLGDKPTANIVDQPLDVANRVAGNFFSGGAQEAGGALLNKGIAKAGSAIASTLGSGAKALEKTPVNNLDEILSASERLGVKPIEAIKTSNPAFQKMESGLSQSGSFPAMSVRKQYDDFFKGLEQAGEKVSSLKTPDSDFALGKGIQDELGNLIAQKRAPVKELYDDVMPDLRKIPVDKSVVNKQFGALKRNPIFDTDEGKAFLKEHQNILLNKPELSSLKEYRSTLKGLVSDQSPPIEQMRVDALRDAVTKIRNNSVEIQKMDLPKNMHGEVDDLISRIALADSAHASNLKEINSIKSLLSGKDFGSPSTFLNRLSGTKEAGLAEKAGNLDITSLRNMKDKFPSVFEKARTAKVNDMISRSTGPKGFNENSFFKQYENLDQELKDLLFDPQMQAHIADLKTLKAAVPQKLGPSGTPEGIMSMDMFNPKRNIQDFLIKQSLDGSEFGGTILKKGAEVASGAGALGGQAAKPSLQAIAGGLRDKTPNPLPMVADTSENQQFDISAAVERSPQSFGKFAPVLQEAARRGDAALNSTTWLLQQTDPEFRQMYQQMSGANSGGNSAFNP